MSIVNTSVKPSAARSSFNIPGKMLTVCSGKGGTGKSFIASISAAFLLVRSGLSIALADFDLQFGDLGVLFDIHPKSTLLELIPVIEELDSNLIRSASSKHKEGLDLFLSPPQAEYAELLETRHVRKIIQVFKETYDLIIVNTGPRLSETHLDLFEDSELVLAVVNQQISSLKACAQIKSIYDRLGAPSERFALVVNEFERSHPIGVDKIEESLAADVIGIIPKLSYEEFWALGFGTTTVDSWPIALKKSVEKMCSQMLRKLNVQPKAELERDNNKGGVGWRRFFKG